MQKNALVAAALPRNGSYRPRNWSEFATKGCCPTPAVIGTSNKDGDFKLHARRSRSQCLKRARSTFARNRGSGRGATPASATLSHAWMGNAILVGSDQPVLVRADGVH